MTSQLIRTLTKLVMQNHFHATNVARIWLLNMDSLLICAFILARSLMHAVNVERHLFKKVTWQLMSAFILVKSHSYAVYAERHLLTKMHWLGIIVSIQARSLMHVSNVERPSLMEAIYLATFELFARRGDLTRHGQFHPGNKSLAWESYGKSFTCSHNSGKKSLKCYLHGDGFRVSPIIPVPLFQTSV